MAFYRHVYLLIFFGADDIIMATTPFSPALRHSTKMFYYYYDYY